MRTLVIDDSKTQAIRLARTLERHGFEVDLAFDGASGIESCITKQPDIMLTDVCMPEIDGYEVCRRLRAREDTRHLPIIILTLLNEPAEVVRALAAGANNFVTKPYSDETLLARMRRLVEQPPRDDSAPVATLHGEEFLIEASRSRILDVLVSSLEDAADRNAELELSRASLARAKAEREDLLAIVAHELKTPLSTLSLRAALTLRKAERNELPIEESIHGWQSTIKQVKRMVTLIDDLTDISRIESNGFSIDKLPTDLVEIARDAAERQRASSPQHSVHIDAPPSLVLSADPSRVDQVITNLLSNAVKYSPQGGAVTISIGEDNGYARLSVRDQGIGITGERLSRLFQRYYRTEEGIKTAAGLGLGLYISRLLIELHGGSVGATSQPNVGSTFWFTLPLASHAAPDAVDKNQ